MANTYDFLGDYNGYFAKSSLQVYCKAAGRLQYIGKTEAEKTIAVTSDLAEWWDNSSGTQTLYVLDIDKFGLSVNFSFSQVYDYNALAMAWNGDLDTTDADRAFIFFGSAPNSLGEYEWRFVANSRASLSMTLVIRKGICVPQGDVTVGSPGAYWNTPVTVRALQDTSITNTKRDMAYLIIDKRDLS